MTAINKATFKGDVALSEMTVNEGVTSIYDEAFTIVRESLFIHCHNL